MLLILFVLLLIVLFGVGGFALSPLLWLIAGILLVVWLLGFVFRSGTGTARGSWWRW
jgi:hypothetical protein